MTWSPTVELAERAKDLARQKHGRFSKRQMIDASKEVFGGYGADPYKPVETLEDVANAGQAMAFIDGNYPAGMPDCFVVGISGGCGPTCPVYQDGRCDEPGEDWPAPASVSREGKTDE